jgi:hypothetical protein
MNAMLSQPAHDARPLVAALTSRVMAAKPAHRAPRWPSSDHWARAFSTGNMPYATSGADAKLVAVLFDTRVPHRDSFAKYAAAFFSDLYRSSLALASSLRNRAFCVSTSLTGRFTATAGPSAALSLPTRLSLIQFHRLDSGIPNRLASWLPPIDSPT